MPILSEAALSPGFSYDEIADAYAAGVDSAPYNALYERPAMLDLLPPLSGKRVLDAGCGAGWYAAELARRGAFVTAVDSSAAMIRHARKRIAAVPPAQPVEFRVADLAQPLSFAADSGFDGIVASLVVHYVRNWGPMLTEFRRVLGPGRWLLFSTHHPATEAIRLDTQKYLEIEAVEDSWKWVGTVRYYRRPLSAIVAALTTAGFGIEQLVEPIPTDAFKMIKPAAYERLLKHPEFLIVRASTLRSQSVL
ncbi:MAG TPA: methyltransferase domain-containing protein [Vicinamibacterales bacterium]|nr:methyltransferase domain-containing protein [Vicinamibacterales bacterium]